MQIVPLSEPNSFDYVQVTGEDTRTFLQGQITCNVDLLSENQALHGALCNLKGRVIADFHLFLLAESHILLQTRRGAGAKIIDTLSRYAVFSKVELTVADGPVAVFGVIGESAAAAFQETLSQFPADDYAVVSNEDFLLVRIPGSTPRYQLWCQNREALSSLNKLDVMEEQAPTAAWQLADIRAGIVHIDAQSSESYTPQLLNYDISGVVDFEKGCCTGQEVVARMHYRAKAKKRLFRLSSEASLGTDSIIAAADDPPQSVAEMLSVTTAQGDKVASEALAIMSTELVASKPALQLANDSQERVKLEPLPYSSD